MSLAAQKYQEGHVTMGQNGRMFFWGTFTFNGTDTGGELKVRVRKIESIKLQQIETAENADVTTIVDEVEKDGQIAVPSTGSITITRAGTVTSGQKYAFFGIGF